MDALQGRRKRGGLGRLQPPPLVLGKTINPISTRGADYAHHSTTVLTMLKYVPAALICISNTHYIVFRVLELPMLTVVDCSEIAGADGNKMFKNYCCIILKITDAKHL